MNSPHQRAINYYPTETAYFGPQGTLTDVGIERLRCSKCGKQFGSQTALNAHMRHQHTEVGFTCEVCALQFRTYFQMYRHRCTLRVKYS
ncbi:hypothetical protein ACOME3_003037 [Neoechinorhynchus agilis]